MVHSQLLVKTQFSSIILIIHKCDWIKLKLQAMARWCQIPTLKPSSSQHFRTAHSILLHPWGASAKRGSGIRSTYYTVPIQTSCFTKALRSFTCTSFTSLRDQKWHSYHCGFSAKQSFDLKSSRAGYCGTASRISNPSNILLPLGTFRLQNCHIKSWIHITRKYTPYGNIKCIIIYHSSIFHNILYSFFGTFSGL